MLSMVAVRLWYPTSEGPQLLAQIRTSPSLQEWTYGATVGVGMVAAAPSVSLLSHRHHAEDGATFEYAAGLAPVLLATAALMPGLSAVPHARTVQVLRELCPVIEAQ